ncbi:hypothetical protein VMCG_07752 [Cytospora schulzeri]|uniref:Uncharacterized protein n=1 Tax=Cytospora schulzeri TaxID=448051 RepID=A0A423VZS6_9PEZI|nr:hypothetical protein VMCG_07752 [Valsa malicola]
MANGLDRFERLFSKRKPAPSRNTTASNINGSAPSAEVQSGPPSPEVPVFPQAPFIRPKTNASRMHARDELVISSSRSTGPTSSSGSRTSWRLSGSESQAMSENRRQSNAAVVIETSPKTKSIIQELPVQEFMNLTDEDIAEVKTKAPSAPPARLPPPPPVLPPNPRSPAFVPTNRLSTMLPPPLAPDEVAAFQAARIAKKYDFDFLYIVNFWPSRMSHLHRPANASKRHSHSHSSSTISSTTSSSSKAPSILYSPTSDCPTTKNSTPRNSLQAPLSERGGSTPYHHITDCCPDTTSPRSGITGRLLTGYGLNTLEAPFRLSAKAHRKILREGNDGWIEYRKSDAKDNEFARGYARSFYTGCTLPGVPAPSPWRSSMSTSTSDNSAGNRNSFGATAGGGQQSASLTVAAATTGNTNNINKKNTSHKSAKPPMVNRGIVFAAYRRPRHHGGTVHSSQAELDALEKEAETLVELILDFHQGRRRWELYQEAMMTSD